MIGATLAALDPDRYDDDLPAFQRSKYVSLTEEQRAAIATFVRAMAGHDEIGGAAAEWAAGAVNDEDHEGRERWRTSSRSRASRSTG